MPRLRITYTGRVQGVGFRATAAHTAAGYDITGWVGNQPDGSVLLEAQGPDSELAAFRAALRARMASNIRAEVETLLPEVLDEPGFDIRR